MFLTVNLILGVLMIISIKILLVALVLFLLYNFDINCNMVINLVNVLVVDFHLLSGFQVKVLWTCCEINWVGMFCNALTLYPGLVDLAFDGSVAQEHEGSGCPMFQ